MWEYKKVEAIMWAKVNYLTSKSFDSVLSNQGSDGWEAWNIRYFFDESNKPTGTVEIFFKRKR